MSSAVTHSQPSAGGSVTKQKPAHACTHCHRRKVRCDARTVGFPCSNCRSYGSPDCRIHEKQKRPAARSILNPVPILCQPPPVSNRSSEPVLKSAASLAAVSYNVESPASTLRLSTSRTISGSVAGPTPHVPHIHLPQPTDEWSTDYQDRAGLENHLLKLIDDEEPDGREIQRGVRVIYVGHHASNMSFLIRQQRNRDHNVYHFAANEISRRHHLPGHDQLLGDAHTLPEQSLADELVEAYFAYVNPGYPIVDEDQFMAQYRNRDAADSPPILILQAILLVGAHVGRERPERDELKAGFFRRSKWLFDNRIERNRDILVQAALLLTWHSDTVDDDVAANAHYWVGVAARIATGLGMHRDLMSSRFAAGDRRMWRRVWWILVQFDVMVALSYGRPQAINLEDCDVQELSPADFEGCGHHVQIEYVIQFTKFCTMISYILRERFGLRVSAEHRKAILPQADEALASWSLGLPDILRLHSLDMDPWLAMLHLSYNNFLILLHRPHLRLSTYSDDYGPHDAGICSAAAGVITSIFEGLRHKDHLKFLWCSGVYALFTAMLQVRVELRFSNPILAINALRRLDSTLQSLRELSRYWSNAKTILRLFEQSKRLQQDLQMVNNAIRSSRIAQSVDKNLDAASLAYTPTVEPSRAGRQLSQQGQTLSSPDNQRPTGNSSPTELVEAQVEELSPAPQHVLGKADHVCAGQPANQLVQPREYSDWRQLFAFADTEQSEHMTLEGFSGMEEEWRELYWQEPQMSDLFQDDEWMYGQIQP